MYFKTGIWNRRVTESPTVPKVGLSVFAGKRQNVPWQRKHRKRDNSTTFKLLTAVLWFMRISCLCRMIFLPMKCYFRKKKLGTKSVTDGQTDGRTYGRTGWSTAEKWSLSVVLIKQVPQNTSLLGGFPGSLVIFKNPGTIHFEHEYSTSNWKATDNSRTVIQ